MSLLLLRTTTEDVAQVSNTFTGPQITWSTFLFYVTDFIKLASIIINLQHKTAQAMS